MVKIGRCPKNYGLTKVQARRMEKESQRQIFKSSEPDANESGDGSFRIEEIWSEEQARCGATQSVETGQGEYRQELRKQDCCRVLPNDEIPPIAIAYLDPLERAIEEAEWAISKFFNADGKGKRRVHSSKSSRYRVAKSLKASLRLLSDCRYIKLMNRIAEKRCSREHGPLLYPVSEKMGVDKKWTSKMTKSIHTAVARLGRDQPKITATTERKRWTNRENPLPVPPLLLDTHRTNEIQKRASCGDHRFWVNTCSKCKRNAALKKKVFQNSYTKYRTNTSSEKNCEESPRERLNRKMEEHGFGNDSLESGSQTRKSELSRIIATAVIELQKNSGQSKYESMSRPDRRDALRSALANKLQPRRLLPTMLRHLKHELDADQDGVVFYASSDMKRLILAAVTQNGTQHVITFVKNVAAEFLGSDVEAFFARQECYMLWSSVIRASRLRLSQRLRSFARSFTDGFGNLEKPAEDSLRCSLLAIQQLIVKLPQLIRRNKYEETKRDVVGILHRYSERIMFCICRYGKVIMYLLSMQYAREAGNCPEYADNTQMCLVFAFTGLQNLQTALLTGVDDILRSIRKHSEIENACVPVIRSLLSKVICREASSAFELMVVGSSEMKAYFSSNGQK